MAASRFQTLISPHTFLPFFFFVFSSSSFSFIWLAAESYASEDDSRYTNCSLRFTCGPGLLSTRNITYPFWGNGRARYCGLGGYELRCQDDEYAFMDFGHQRYRVLDINQTGHVMTVARNDRLNDLCLTDPVRNTTMDNSTPFNYNIGVKNVSVFYCSNPDSYLLASLGEFPCPLEDYPNRTAFFIEDEVMGGVPKDHPELNQCKMITFPMLQSTLDELVQGRPGWSEVLGGLFIKLTYRVDSMCSGCELSGGICGTNNLASPQDFECYCSHKSNSRNCSLPEWSWTFLTERNEPSTDESKASRPKMKVVIGVASGGGVALIFIALLFFVRYRNRKKPGHSYAVSRSISSALSSRTDFEKGDLYYGLPVFDYDELREATNNFDPQKELGDGGFGTVFYGKLRDGRSVAVKRLYENNYKRVEQFMNEIDILARLRHPNLVILYGCTSRQSHRLLLVYEYVPNGTVADHLHGDLAKPGSLPWSTRLNIAIETANALVYLHATDIIHRDVKTNNILLDENFSVKVADFGLSRLFPFNVTHVSTAPQGTPGYVDPEYHQCYQLTEKSDVYSFGVVLMELISSLPAVDITRHRHEINLSTMAINKIHNHALHELVDPNLGFDSNCDIRTMITAVAELGFRCLQNAKDMRPSMAEVLSTLKDIQKQGTDGNNNAVENDDAALLRANPPSPDSVMAKFISTSTTPNTSG